jgi:hypothetical protein
MSQDSKVIERRQHVLGWFAQRKDQSWRFTFSTDEARAFQKDGDKLIGVCEANLMAASEVRLEELQKRIDVLLIENARLQKDANRYRHIRSFEVGPRSNDEYDAIVDGQIEEAQS